MNGNRLRDLRILRGHTQESLAEILDTDSRQIWRWENGKTKPSVDVVAKIARALETSSDYLLELTDDPSLPESKLSRDEQQVLNALRLGDKLTAIELIVAQKRKATV